MGKLLAECTKHAEPQDQADVARLSPMLHAHINLLGHFRFELPPPVAAGERRAIRMPRTRAPLAVPRSLPSSCSRDPLKHWDEMLHVAGSLELGWVTASLFLGKLQAQPRQRALTEALQDYGRLVKTIVLLRNLENEAYRRRMNLQLSKGEVLHALRQFLGSNATSLKLRPGHTASAYRRTFAVCGGNGPPEPQPTAEAVFPCRSVTNDPAKRASEPHIDPESPSRLPLR
jgi:hypothetical protein